ncbi:hypothetical protein K458DRAFT_409429 [Lentithecium fluviatile CBS 122367]|uniref:Uncharacterized protein n=1 Tax=Lentithecium fluviatile CBS 122367 TaxID=1168545 RepID=A0A6G1IHX1_9PLEO|nr:hypothetical protein K458DRAFT_409429 [Lentithecium fluviatile CBS 122367]
MQQLFTAVYNFCTAREGVGSSLLKATVAAIAAQKGTVREVEAVAHNAPLERRRALCARRPPPSLHHCRDPSSVFIKARESNGITTLSEVTEYETGEFLRSTFTYVDKEDKTWFG